jgi:hypothetical protein
MRQLNVVMLTAALYYAAVLILCSHSTVSVPVDGDAGPAPQQPEEQENAKPEHQPKPPPFPTDDESKPVAVPVNTTQPKLNDYQESTKKIAINNNQPESKVTITVGEDNGFQYTVNGHTYSRERIAISGEYFNDEYHSDGYVRLFLVAEPAIGYYAVRPLSNRLDVYVQNYYYEDFYFEVYTPYPVSGYDLRHGQINSTAILITGPSRSVVYPDGKKSSVVTSKKPKH